MEIKTKYDMGQKLFWVDKWDGIFRVHYDAIKSINIGGKYYEKYEIGNTTRGDTELWVSFEDAKKVAKDKQKAENSRYLKIIDEYRPPFNL